MSAKTKSMKPAVRKNKQTKSWFGRRQRLILAGVYLVGCIFVGFLLVVFYISSRTGVGQQTIASFPVGSFEVTFREPMAKDAYEVALPFAQRWDDSVQLVSVSTTWNNVSLDDIGQVDVWDFSFFAPERDRMYFTIVTVDQPVDGQAHPFKLQRPPLVINPDEWAVDSSQAIAIWLNNGGGVFVQTFPENQVEILLRQSLEGGGPVWNIIGTSADQSQLLYLTIDATNGMVLNKS